MTTTTFSPEAEASTPPIVLLADSDDARIGRHYDYMASSGLWVAVQRAPGRVLEDVVELRPDALVTATFFDGEPVGPELVALLKNRADTRDVPIVLFAEIAEDRVTQRADVCLEPQVGADVLLQNVRAVLRAKQPRRPAAGAQACTTDVAANSTRLVPLASDVPMTLDDTKRACPSCGGLLDWIERGLIGGDEYDYYHWCTRGCGLHCFNRTARSWLRLAG